MTRISAVLLAAAALGGWITPSFAQKALKAPVLEVASRVYRTPNLFLASHSTAVRLTTGPSVDSRVLHVVTRAMPTRVAWSTEPLTRIPARAAWTHSHTALASAFTITLLIDAAQTRALARQGWVGYRETNPLLGERPSVGRLNTYTVLAGLSVLGAAAAAPPRLRPWLLGAAIAVQAFTISSSVRQGLPIRFP
jgi:hypothetical protein